MLVDTKNYKIDFSVNLLDRKINYNICRKTIHMLKYQIVER